MTGTSRYTFERFVLEPSDARLRRDGTPVALTPKAFGVLELLVTRAGRLVTKRELLQALWPDVFVGDAALKVCIREIRRALGDDTRAPRFIETAHRRGYRFVAPVDVAGERRVGDAAAALPAASPAPAITSAGPADAPAPPVRYARSGDVSIAYQVLGDGPIDLVFVMGWVSHLDYFWTEPSFARFLRRLASFSRLILFDKRGTGLSDRVADLPTLEQRMDDVRAVMDAVGSPRAALLGVSEGGPMCSLFAATYPEKTLALVMFGTYAKRAWDPEYPWAPTFEQREEFYELIRRDWGGPVGIETRAPSRAADPQFRAWWATYLRMGASPGAALRLTRMNAEIDVRHVLPHVRVPSLVLHRRDDRCLLAAEGRYVASRIPGARYVELAGDDHLPFVGDQDSVVAEIEAFLTGARPGALVIDRVLGTVLSVRVARAADHTERAAFAEHARKEITWYRGRAAADETTVAAVFDGPARAIRCAAALMALSARFGVSLAAGLHTGEYEEAGGRCDGPAVEVATELASQVEGGAIVASSTVRDLVAGSGVRFEPAAAAWTPPSGLRVYRVVIDGLQPART